MTRKALVLAAGPLAGCATATMDRVMSSWEGEHIDTVVKQWGIPTGEREFRGRKFYVWDTVGSAVVPSSSTTTGSVGPGGTFSATTTTVGGGVISQSCQRMIGVDSQDRVSSWQWSGNGCCVMTVAGFCATLPNPKAIKQ